MVDHFLAVQGKANKRTILLALHPNIRACFFAAVVPFVIATEFTIIDFRILMCG